MINGSLDLASVLGGEKGVLGTLANESVYSGAEEGQLTLLWLVSALWK